MNLSSLGITMTIFLYLIIWTLIGMLYYTFKILSGWGRTRVDFNVLEKVVLAPAYVVHKIFRALT